MFKSNLVKRGVATIGFFAPVLRKDRQTTDHERKLAIANLKVKTNHPLRYDDGLLHICVDGAVLWIGKLTDERIKTVFDIVCQNWTAIRELCLRSKPKGY